MKKALLTASVVFAMGYAAAVVAQFAGLISSNVFSVPVLVGGLIAAALVGLVVGDYTRKPQFRVRRSQPEARGAESAPISAAGNVACDWTYTTRSA